MTVIQKIIRNKAIKQDPPEVYNWRVSTAFLSHVIKIRGIYHEILLRTLDFTLEIY